MKGILFISVALCLSANVISANNITHVIRVANDTAKKTDATDTTDNEVVKHRKFEIGLEGANDQSNHGVKNSTPLPYLEPSFTYIAKSGFFIEVDDQYLLATKNVPKSRAGFDVFGLNTGWDIDLSDKTTLDFNVTFNSYKKKSPNLIKSGLFLTPEAYIDQDIIADLEGRLTIDYDMYAKPKKSNQPKTPNDFIFTPDLLYTFDWDFGKNDNCSLSVIPEVSMDFGTKNFLTVYRNNVIGDTATGNKTKYVTSGSGSFGALDYNVMLTIELALGKFIFEPEFTYTVPLYNQTNIVASKPYGYGSITLKYTIKGKK